MSVVATGKLAGNIFHTYDVRDGLPDNYVASMEIDRTGRLWIGAHGVCSFDGYRIKNYQLPQGVNLKKILLDRDDNVWAVGYNNVYLLKGSAFVPAERFLKEMGLDLNVENVFADRWGNLYFQTPDRLVYHDFDTGANSQIPVRQGKFRTLIPDFTGKGKFFVIEENGSLARGEMSSGRIKQMLSDTKGYRNGVASQSGKLYLFDYNVPGVLEIDTRTPNPTPAAVAALNGMLVFDIAVLDKGGLLAATNNSGIVRIGADGSLVEDSRHVKGNPYSLPSNHVTRILLKENQLAVGTAKSGFSVADLTAPVFHSADIGIDEDLTFFREAPDGGLWVGSDGKGLLKLSASMPARVERVLDTSNSPLTSNAVIGINSLAGGRTVIGTYGGGLYEFDGSALRRIYPEIKELEYVRHLAQTKNGPIWAGTFSQGLLMLDGKNWRQFTYKNSELLTNCITDLKLRGDSLLVATSSGLRYVLPGGSAVKTPSEKSLESDLINVMLADSRGLIWVGGQNGVRIYDGGFRLLGSLDRKSGLSDNITCAIAEDRYGNVWISSNNGLTCVAVNADKGKYEFDAQPFYEADGLGKITFNKYSLASLPDGSVVAGGLGAFVSVKPEMSGAQQLKEKVYLSSLQVDGKNVDPGDVLENGNVPWPDRNANRIEVKYGNAVVLSVSTNDLASAHKLHYEYRLGRGTDWKPVTGNSISFEALPSGSHLLEVRVAASSAVTDFTIYVKPPFWRSTTALILYGLLLCCLLFFLWRYLDRRNKRKLHTQMIEQTFNRQENQPLSRDEKFLNDVKVNIERHLDEEEFGVAALSEAMNMSRSNLYKRIQTVTGKSPLEFIRLIRIRKGKQLLDENGDSNISQIAYQVGLSPKQFSKYFKEEYGVLPSRYQKRPQ